MCDHRGEGDWMTFTTCKIAKGTELKPNALLGQSKPWRAYRAQKIILAITRNRQLVNSMRKFFLIDKYKGKTTVF